MEAGIEKVWITAVGYKAMVYMNDNGTRCGYVAVKESHPTYFKSYRQAIALLDLEDGYIDVHGGVTFFGRLINEPYLWWFGFDCNHDGDGPDPDFEPKDKGEDKLLDWGSVRGGIPCSKEYCIHQCEKLAKQLASVKQT